MTASQEFRDGAATGAATMARRARLLSIWGVPLTDVLLDKLAEGIVAEYGGKVHVDAMGYDPGSDDG